MADTLVKEAQRFCWDWGSSFYVSTAASAAATLPADAGPCLTELVKQLLALITETKTSSLKDNDLIYHAIVPSEATLSHIEKSANVAEPIPIQEIYASPEVQKLVGQDIFIKLVPLSVIESSSLYSEEKAKILRNEGERCDLADGEMQATLEHLGLPGSLSKFGAASGNDPMSTMADPGPQIRSWSSEIRGLESDKRIESYISELVQLRDKTTSDLDWCLRELDSEQRECEQARVRFDYHFEQSPSGSYTKSWRTDIRNDKDALAQARASDDQVLSLWNNVREDAGTLAGGEDSVEQVFAEAVSRADQVQGGAGGGGSLLDLDLPDDEGNEMQKHISSIHEALARLDRLRKERSDTLADLKERIHNDDISQLLILNRKSQNVEPTLFAAELEKFRPHQARLQAAIQQQQVTLQNVQQMFSQLTQGKKGKDIQNRFAKAERAKKDLQARYKRAYDAFKEVRMGVTYAILISYRELADLIAPRSYHSKGTDFYRELSGLVATLRAEVSQFVTTRGTERSQMVSAAEMKQRMSAGRSDSASLDRSFDGLNLGGSSNTASAYQPISPTRPSYPSMSPASSRPPPPPAGQPAYGYASLPSPAPSAYSGGQPSYTNGSYARAPPAPYAASSTPSLPPKPPTQSQPYRQPSIGSGLPPPPSQPQYQQPSAGLPPPPGGLSYASQQSHYSSPPPPQQPAYSGYGQAPNAPLRPPQQQQHAGNSGYNYQQAPPQQQYGQPQQNYGSPAEYQQPQYGQPPRPPPQAPLPYGHSHQQQQSPYPPQQQSQYQQPQQYRY